MGRKELVTHCGVVEFLGPDGKKGAGNSLWCVLSSWDPMGRKEPTADRRCLVLQHVQICATRLEFYLTAQQGGVRAGLHMISTDHRM
ncbi:hypothetical protein J4Q44_G00348000, partial [Coregonus suidteri]